MKLSVVIAVYNRRDMIAVAMDRVYVLSVADMEHSIQNGGSRDGMAEIAHDRTGRETQLRREADSGFYDATNRGIRRATGEVIGLTHSAGLHPGGSRVHAHWR